ncbi:MAG: YezD family protein [Lachnospiraceae bacterium]|nr:YezD family protein [Lachnospiraceae bacterium]
MEEKKKPGLEKSYIKKIEEQVRRIKSGSVTAVIHNGRVVQLNTIEKGIVYDGEREKRV